MTDEEKLKIYSEANVLSDLLLQRVINDDMSMVNAMSVCSKTPIFLLVKTLEKEEVSEYMDKHADTAAEIVNEIIDRFSVDESMSVPELYCLVSAVADYMTSMVSQ